MALVSLFAWLLWGDFCYTLMESVTSPIMTLKFDKLGASNTEMGIILATIPGIVYTTLNPIVSFKSDRHRGRFGRRIPFILFTLPLLVLALVGLAFGEKIGFGLFDWLHPDGTNFARNHAALWTMGVMLIAFTFFNSFVTSVFWYLFNDVVPEEFLARFMSLFRMMGLGASGLYQLLIFPRSGTHATEIFLGAAALYLVGFGLMCLNVREGQYPPPPETVDGQTGPWSGVKTYLVECHSHGH
jgi:Na+/melibiose symporter-like transporter